MQKNCDVIFIFQIFGQFGAAGIWIPDTECARFMFSLIVTFCLPKTGDRTKKSLTQPSHYCFE